MTNMYADNYYLFIVIRLTLFLLYKRFHSSPVENENLRSNGDLMSNSTKNF